MSFVDLRKLLNMDSMKVVTAAIVTAALGVSLPIVASRLVVSSDAVAQDVAPHAPEVAQEENYLRTAMAEAVHARAVVLKEQGAQLERGKLLYANCVACHKEKAEGQLLLKAPALAAQEEWYILSQLKKFKTGVRGAHPKDIEGMQMMPMMALLQTDEHMQDVAHYLSSLEFTPSALELEGDAEKGKAAYMTCAACHGDKAQGNVLMKAPALAGQADWYIVSQLKKFKSGIRGAHKDDLEGMQMAPMAQLMVDEAAMADVAAYLHGLR